MYGMSCFFSQMKLQIARKKEESARSTAYQDYMGQLLKEQLERLQARKRVDKNTNVTDAKSLRAQFGGGR